MAPALSEALLVRPGYAIPQSTSRRLLACGILKPRSLWCRFQPEIGSYVVIKIIKKLTSVEQAWGLPWFSPRLVLLFMSRFVVRRREMPARYRGNIFR
jgi:hypothetical protein